MKEHVALLQKRVWEMHVPDSRGYAGFFSWLDLRAYLNEDSYEGEQELYKFIYEHGNVIIAPVRMREVRDL